MAAWWPVAAGRAGLAFVVTRAVSAAYLDVDGCPVVVFALDVGGWADAFDCVCLAMPGSLGLHRDPAAWVGRVGRVRCGISVWLWWRGRPSQRPGFRVLSSAGFRLPLSDRDKDCEGNSIDWTL